MRPWSGPARWCADCREQLRRLNPAPTFTYAGITMPAAMIAAADSNHMWISCPNSSAPESAWPAFFVRADGITVGRTRRNRPGMAISTVSSETHDTLVAGYQAVRELSSAEAAWLKPLVLWRTLQLVPEGDDPTGWADSAERM